MIMEHADMVSRLARTYFRNDADAEDAVQEAMVKFMFVDLSAVENKQAFLHSATLNLFRDIYRRQSNMRELDQHASIDEAVDEDDPLSYAIRAEEECELSRSIDDLSDDLSIVANMYYLDCLSYKDIAYQLGLPEGTVASRMNTVRKYLARGVYESTT